MTESTPEAMRLAQHVLAVKSDLGGCIGHYSDPEEIARALDDAGLRQVVEALARMLAQTHRYEGGCDWYQAEARRALDLLTGRTP